jgi:signal transduction histidine kinase
MNLADAIEISVSDHGPGIPAAEQQAMWGPSSEAPSGTTGPKAASWA